MEEAASVSCGPLSIKEIIDGYICVCVSLCVSVCACKEREEEEEEEEEEGGEKRKRISDRWAESGGICQIG